MNNKLLSIILLMGGLMLVAPTYSLALPIYPVGTSLGLTTQSPTLEASSASIDYLEFGPDGDLSTFGAEVDSTNGVSTVGLTEFDFGFGFSLADPTVGATGGFGIFDLNGLFLGGDLIAVGFLEDVIELQFGSLIGGGAGAFGSSVVAQLAFDDPLGLDPFASLNNGQLYTAFITVSNVAEIHAVPEPSTLLLFLSALLGFGWFRKKPGAGAGYQS
uniref:PEP-CTERM sorting domain-containing protein n=1 Tax=Marinobacterium profundum TaxID=1714300 RepID=UPI00082D0E57|nr:PEP-CTERM sorting domain-containing protein [Marinobacterium profundum]